MKSEKKQAEDLLSAFSYLDDELIDFAKQPSFQKKKAVILKSRRAFLLTACTAVLLVLFIGIGIYQTVQPDVPTSGSEMTEVPLSPPEGQIALKKEELSPFLFNNTPSLIVKKESSYLYYHPLDTETFENIEKLSSHPQREIHKGEELPELWICDGKGTVFSPYLKKNPGNLYFGKVFSYQAEVIPNDELQKILNSYL